MIKISRLLHSSVFKNGIWLYVLQFVNTVLPLFTIPYVTRILGAEGYGRFSIAYNWVTYCQVVVEYGFTLSGARKIAILDESNHVDKLWRSIVAARSLLFIGSLFILSTLCLAFMDLDFYVNALLLMLMVFAVIFQMNWLFQGKQQMKFITIVNVIGRALSVLLIFLFVKKAEHVRLYCLFYSFTFLFSSLSGLVIAIKKYQIHPSLARKEEIITELKDGWPLFTSSAISRIFGSIGVTILGIYASDEVLGIYSAIYKIPFILNLCFSPIGQAIFPFISKEYDKDSKKAYNLILKIMTVITGIFLIICISIIALRGKLVDILFGHEYVNYTNLVLFMAPQVIFGIINNFLGVQTLVASGNSKKYSTSIMINLAVLVALCFILSPILGAYGTAISSLIAEITLTVVLLTYCKKLAWNIQKG